MKALELRLPPPLQAALAALAMVGLDRALPTGRVALPGAGWLALVLAAASATVLLLALLAFRRAGTTVDPLHPGRVSALVTTGVYAWSRNPMYLGLAGLLGALGLWLGHLLAPLPLAAFVLAVTRLQILPEERVLAARFGEAWSAWQARVPRWGPVQLRGPSRRSR